MARMATRESQAQYKRGGAGALEFRSQLKRAMRRGNLTPEQAVDARSVLSDIKTPMAAGNGAVGGGATANIANNVTRTIPAGSVLYVEGLAPGDTINSVTIDGVNIFSNGQIGQGLLNPATLHASGLLIPSSITQQIVVNVTNNGGAGANVVCTLLAPSIEVEGILDAAADGCL